MESSDAREVIATERNAHEFRRRTSAADARPRARRDARSEVRRAAAGRYSRAMAQSSSFGDPRVRSRGRLIVVLRKSVVTLFDAELTWAR